MDVGGLSTEELADPNLPHLLGVVLGRSVGSGVGAVVGLPSATEDECKAIAAGAAAAGGVDLFHLVGITPEAPTLDAATHGQTPDHHTTVTTDDLRRAAELLTTATGGEPLSAVCLGTPHFSVAEFVETVDRLGGRRIANGVTVLITTSRAVAAAL